MLNIEQTMLVLARRIRKLEGRVAQLERGQTTHDDDESNTNTEVE
jgi:hypothetical protein